MMHTSIIDIHTHILPHIDDGSKSIEETRKMLELEKMQDVSIVVATPHFYANQDTPDSFLSRRDYAFELLQKNKDTNADNNIKIIPGAEVSYYVGIAKSKELEKLQITGTKMLLIEMPMEIWTERMIQEIRSIQNEQGLKPLIAHIDRYMTIQPKKILREMIEADVLIQANANAFLKYPISKKMFKLLKNGVIDYVGSDCHDLRERRSNIGMAMKKIEKRMSKDDWSLWIKNQNCRFQ